MYKTIIPRSININKTYYLTCLHVVIDGDGEPDPSVHKGGHIQRQPGGHSKHPSSETGTDA